MTRLQRPPCPDAIEVDCWTAPYWAAVAERRIVVCACAQCQTLRMPPGPYCPQCRSQRVAWIDVPGTGQVYSYTIVRRAVIPRMESHLPYAPAVIGLDGAPPIRLISAVVESELEDLRVGAAVEPVWHALASGQLVPFFRLAATKQERT